MMSFRIQEERQKPLNTNCQSFIDVCITYRYISISYVYTVSTYKEIQSSSFLFFLSLLGPFLLAAYTYSRSDGVAITSNTLYIDHDLSFFSFVFSFYYLS